MENFDGIGQYRETEGGAPIDTTGTLDGAKFDGIAELGVAVRDNPAVPTCLVNRLSAYALGRTPERGEKAWINELKEQFAKSGYVVPELMRRIATSPELYRVAPPKAPAKSHEIVAATGN